MTKKRLLGEVSPGARWRIAAWSAAGLVLAAPLAAMQVTDEVNWSLGDFALMGAVVGGAGLSLELAVRRRGDAAFRLGVAVALAAALLLIWLTGAVGLIGNEDEPANLAYVAVLAVALFGAGLARFRPAGMAWAMLAAAVGQAIVPLIASRWVEAAWSAEVFGLTLIFCVLWLLAGGLFRKAAG